MADISSFINSTVTALQQPIDDWFDAQDDTGIVGALRRARASVTTLPRFRDALTHALDLAAHMGTNRNLTRDQQAQLDQIIQQQVAYAIGFIGALPGLSRAQALARAASYASAITQVISQFHADQAGGQGFPTLSIYPGDKNLKCNGFCKCTLRIIQLAGLGNWNVYWDLHAQESCEDCVRLNQSWSPLEIRNYQIQQAKMVSNRDIDIIRAAFQVAFGKN